MSYTDRTPRYPEALTAIETVLEARWPKAFFLNQTRRKPLKVGIRHDIVAAGVELTPSALSNALRTYTINRFYQQSLRVGAGRVDLNGNIHDYVNSVDALRASNELKRRALKKAARLEACARLARCMGRRRRCRRSPVGCRFQI